MMMVSNKLILIDRLLHSVALAFHWSWSWSPVLLLEPSCVVIFQNDNIYIK